MSMLFSDIKKVLLNPRVIGNLNKKKIKLITDHSKNADSNTLLIVDKSKNFKRNYLQDAINQGLNTIITNSYIRNILINQVIVNDLENNVNMLLSYRQPFKPKFSIAITGTNGKTSSSWYLAQICKFNNIPFNLTGTLGYFNNNRKIKDSILTTPSNLDLYQFSHSHKINDKIWISEASSHGLTQGRFTNLNIDIAAITNLTRDHLDYHGTFNLYKKSKLLLFEKILNTDGIAIINSRIKFYKEFYSIIKSRKLKYIIFGAKDVYFEGKFPLYISIFKKKYLIKDTKLNKIQKENLECAISCALALNISPQNIIKTFNKLKSPPGRYQEINYEKKLSKIIIDFAHTPEAILSVLKLYSHKSFKPSIVFGCGGERDKGKRKKMGLIANKYANRIYITDDNPRNENPNLIRKTIKKFCPKGKDIPDRRKAIHTAISEIDKKDILIIAGKGHEKYQIIKNKKNKFDDYQVVKNFIK